jgi:hypothetical protein
MKKSTSDEDVLLVDVEVEGEDEDDFAEFLTPGSQHSVQPRPRVYSESTASNVVPIRTSGSGSNSGSRLVIGSAASSVTSSCHSIDTQHECDSTSTNYSNHSSISSASSLFQRHFRFQNPTTLLFSPPLKTTTTTNTPPAFITKNTPPNCRTPPRGNVSTVLAMNNFHQRQQHGSVTTPFSPSYQSPSSEQSSEALSGVSTIDSTITSANSSSSSSSVSSNRSTQVSILTTATLLEDHYQ